MKDLCSTCDHLDCCTGFDAPFLYESDIKRLEDLGKEDFVEDIEVSDFLVKSLKKKENSTNCIFWDEETKNCTVYEQRPFDCRMFPFDIMKIDGEYNWIVFSCNTKSDWKWAEIHLEKLEDDPSFTEIVKNIETFHHTLETSFSRDHKLPYVVLRKVKIK